MSRIARRHRGFALSTLLQAAILVAMPFSVGRAELTPLTLSGFSVMHAVTLPGPPDSVFDAFTGDIREWWDHSFSAKPKALYIEPKPGGGFYEVFDDSGNGALHATVITAKRGQLLRMDGPLGLAGEAISMVQTLEFAARGGDSTHIKLTVNVAGNIKEGLDAAVDGVWSHFLIERFKPYVESGRYRNKLNPAK